MSDSDSDGHPLDQYVHKSKRQRTSPQEKKADTKASVAQQQAAGSADEGAKPAVEDKSILAPASLSLNGVVLVDDASEIVRDFEVQRLSRHPRYFDEHTVVQTFRCFNCGQAGHAARDCTNAARLKPCYLCAQFGHDGRECPNRLCYRCGKPGHIARECPMSSSTSANSKACIRCGRQDCAAAGKGDYFRYEGGCSCAYLEQDLRTVCCMSCGEPGHLLCKRTPKEAATPSCYNCGRLGHYGDACPQGPRPHIAAERRGDEEREQQLLAEIEAEAFRSMGYNQRDGGYGRDRQANGGGAAGGYYQQQQQPQQQRYNNVGYTYGNQQQQRYDDYGGGGAGYGGGGGGGYGGRADPYSGYQDAAAYNGGGHTGHGGVFDRLTYGATNEVAGNGGRQAFSPDSWARAAGMRGGGGGGQQQQQYQDLRRTKTPRW